MQKTATLRKNITLALQQNLLPGLVLQVFAVLTALSYFYYEPATILFSYLGDLKSQYGWKYAMISTAIFGGLIPFVYLALTKQVTDKLAKTGLFYVLFWAYKGVEVDLLYQLQEQWFGNANDVNTLVKKTVVDQFIYGTLWAAPSMAIAYLWKDKLLNFSKTFASLDRQFFCLQIPTVLITNWIIWIPSVLIIYSMPSDLQIPLFNFVLCFFVLLLSTLSKKQINKTTQLTSED
ncbi:hypothetical protein GCM10007916_31380 [Psychromonas marina]|uniref:Uncharacterized protein n=1 Tax=Psychromonas marina TaxID=88364 RepID=A0ABQ6E4G4_9GAMM|nr:hypothetical protein [Psychromonas marina]GLS92068.1 hypothetical protein GCM10007916_31380 [Psychromonas marina]